MQSSDHLHIETMPSQRPIITYYNIYVDNILKGVVDYIGTDFNDLPYFKVSSYEFHKSEVEDYFSQQKNLWNLAILLYKNGLRFGSISCRSTTVYGIDIIKYVNRVENLKGLLI